MAAKRKTPKTLDALVSEAVAASGLSLTAWCKAHKINPRLIYRWKEGDFERPQIKPVAALAKALGVDFDVAKAAVDAAKKG